VDDAARQRIDQRIAERAVEEQIEPPRSIDLPLQSPAQAQALDGSQML
jgi:hypothetical protein